MEQEQAKLSFLRLGIFLYSGSAWAIRQHARAMDAHPQPSCNTA